MDKGFVFSQPGAQLKGAAGCAAFIGATAKTLDGADGCIRWCQAERGAVFLLCIPWYSAQLNCVFELVFKSFG
jgi:hypothetical protein